MLNNKAYVLTETLVVTTFLIGLFTFVYISIIPLTGKYEDKIKRLSDVDIVYKLYHLKKMVKESNLVLEENVQKISCDNLNGDCKKLVTFLELNNFDLLYVNNIKNNYISLIEEYHLLENNIDKNDEENSLILIDKDKNTFAILKYL